jgi:hypothetical protein
VPGDEAGAGEADGKDEDEQQTAQHGILQEGPGGRATLA